MNRFNKNTVRRTMCICWMCTELCFGQVRYSNHKNPSSSAGVYDLYQKIKMV